MNQTFVSMNDDYRGFKLYGGCEPITETLLGNVKRWKPTGCIGFKHGNGVISELTRFRSPMTVDDQDVAKCFGLEIARLLLDSSLVEFETARYESEQRMLKLSVWKNSCRRKAPRCAR